MKKNTTTTEQNNTIVKPENFIDVYQARINGIKSEITDSSDELHVFSVRNRVAFEIMAAECYARLFGLVTDEAYLDADDDEEFSGDGSSWKGVLQDEVRWLLDDKNQAFKIYKGGFVVDTPPGYHGYSTTSGT